MTVGGATALAAGVYTTRFELGPSILLANEFLLGNLLRCMTN